jgi:4-diphosphocytidyl-2-C-methyl-D-erythritol kinase
MTPDSGDGLCAAGKKPGLRPQLHLNRSIALRAFAKINHGLKILGKRPDGYHELRTVYQTVHLHDRVEISLAPGRSTVGIRLRKRIPAGSGLGGASADAAATLVGLERLAGEGQDLSFWARLATRLGSDVPLFLWGGRTLGVGRGEEVYPMLELPRRYCLIVFPGFSVSTPAAYREASLQLTRTRKERNTSCFGAWPRFSLEEWGPAENDFEPVVFARWPELADLKASLIRAGAEAASLTGSGSAVYAIFDSARKLKSALRFVPRKWRVFRTRTVSRAEYRRLQFIC